MIPCTLNQVDDQTHGDRRTASTPVHHASLTSSPQSPSGARQAAAGEYSGQIDPISLRASRRVLRRWGTKEPIYTVEEKSKYQQTAGADGLFALPVGLPAVYMD
jgi:hypothetical protein